MIHLFCYKLFSNIKYFKVYGLICKTFQAQPFKVDDLVIGARDPLTKSPTLVAGSMT